MPGALDRHPPALLTLPEVEAALAAHSARFAEMSTKLDRLNFLPTIDGKLAGAINLLNALVVNSSNLLQVEQAILVELRKLTAAP
jgi:hypothetical protein